VTQIVRRSKSNPFIFGAKKSGAEEVRRLIAINETSRVIDAAKRRNAQHLKDVLEVEAVRKRTARAEGTETEWQRNLREVEQATRKKRKEPKPQKLL